MLAVHGAAKVFCAINAVDQWPCGSTRIAVLTKSMCRTQLHQSGQTTSHTCYLYRIKASEAGQLQRSLLQMLLNVSSCENE